LRNLKTANSSRIIPINPLLIDLGLLDRVEEMGRLKSDRLFPEWAPYRKSTGELRWGQPMTKSWQYLKTVLMLGRADITLYSTRHWMADMLDEAGAPQRLRNRLMGHSD